MKVITKKHSSRISTSMRKSIFSMALSNRSPAIFTMENKKQESLYSQLHSVMTGLALKRETRNGLMQLVIPFMLKLLKTNTLFLSIVTRKSMKSSKEIKVIKM